MTKFTYTINGIFHSETVNTRSVLLYNKTVRRLLVIADVDSIIATSIK